MARMFLLDLRQKKIMFRFENMKAEERLVNALTDNFIMLSREVDPDAFGAILCGVMANTLGYLPQEYFDEMIKVRPCGRRGCNCHLSIQITTTKLFQALRDDWLENCETQSDSM